MYRDMEILRLLSSTKGYTNEETTALHRSHNDINGNTCMANGLWVPLVTPEGTGGNLMKLGDKVSMRINCL